MSDRKIITTGEAKRLRELLPDDLEQAEYDMFDRLAKWLPYYRVYAAAPDLAATVVAQAAEIEKLKRGGAELGRIIKDQLDMVVDATGLHHLIRDDGDGDWEAVWMTMIERANAHPDYRNPEATP